MAGRASKYDALGDFLADNDDDEITLTLQEISRIIGPLPPESYRHQFWANVSAHHDARRRQWLSNGFHASFDRETQAVLFTRIPIAADSLTRSDLAWDNQELRACALAYRRLWNAEQLGELLNKSEIRRGTLAHDLPGRAKGSYEFRMQNISALLDDLGIPYVKGYLPRRNIGRLKPRLVAIINEIWEREDTRESGTSDPESLETRTVSASARLSRRGGSPPTGSVEVRRTKSFHNSFIRDPEVIAWVIMRAAGRCEACMNPAPFTRADGLPFLEVHHLRPLAEGGPDVIENAIAACPNCHRRLHHGSDRVSFRRSILRRAEGLRDFPKKSVTGANPLEL